jgi:fluoride exporter
VTVWVWIGVALLGGVGAIARFALDAAIGTRVDGSFPLGTLAINLSGALALGFVTGLALTGNALILVGTATIGSYTTFSTWMLESHRLTEDLEIPLALLNVVLSLLAGVAAAALGRLLGVHL